MREARYFTVDTANMQIPCARGPWCVVGYVERCKESNAGPFTAFDDRRRKLRAQSVQDGMLSLKELLENTSLKGGQWFHVTMVVRQTLLQRGRRRQSHYHRP